MRFETFEQNAYDEISKKYKVPRYVQKLVLKRTMLSKKLRQASIAVTDYCESIGLDMFHPLYEEAVLNTDIRIYCEEDAGHHSTLAAIEQVLAELKKKYTESEKDDGKM
jgi:hypothetical protein